MGGFFSKCKDLTTLKMTDLYYLPKHVRLALCDAALPLVAGSPKMTHLDLCYMTEMYDGGESEKLLTALAQSANLASITHFRCNWNGSWFDETKESNAELLG